MAEIVKRREILKGRFLKYETIDYIADNGKTISGYEAVQRCSDKRAVNIMAIKKLRKSVILVKQFRPAVGKYCIEFPAGLIDPGETPEQAAARELLEETGYTAEAIRTVWTESSAGMTGELTMPCYAMIDDNAPENRNPVQRMDEDECIEMLDIYLDTLYAFLTEQSRHGVIISGRLMAFALGCTQQWFN